MKNLMFLELLEYWHRSMGGLGVTDQSNRWSRQGAWLSLGLTASLLGLIGPGAAIASEQAEQELSNAIASEQAQSTALASDKAEQNDDALLELPAPLEPSASLEKSPVASAMETEAVAEPVVSSETEEFFQQLSQSSESDPLFIEPVEPEAVDAPDFMDSSDEEDRWIKRGQLGTPSTADPDSDFVGGTSFEERQDLGRPPAWSDYDGEVEVEPLTNTAATTASDAIPAIEFLQVERTPADGRTTALIQGQVVDGDGNLYTDDVLVTLTAAAGRFMGEDADEDRAGFQVVARNGEFQARLQSPLTAQWVRVRAAIDPQWDLELDAEDRPRETDNLPLPNTPYKPLASLEAVEAYTSVEFITNLRPSLVSGSLNLRVGRGNTNFYGPFEEFLDDDDDYGVDVDGGLFAIGTLGEWLFTSAVNLDRGLNDDCDGSGTLFSQSSTCDNRYPVYGDSSEINNLTPSKDSVFARLERTSIIPGAEPDFIMWGDWLTNEFSRPSQLFSATTRTLHGAKANYNFGGLQVTAAYANDIDGYRRDTIVPNGISGRYFFSKRLLVAGSETVFVETEEINRPGFVVERKALQRGRDYDIDYDNGSIIFRRPIISTEFDPFGDTLVRKVVTTYEFEDDGNDNNNGLLAGRLQYNFSRELGQESWIGASYLNEDQDDRDFSLFGIDFLAPLGSDGRFIAEYARSNNGVEFLGDVDGAAYRLEVEGKPTDWLRARAFYRTAEDGFANDSTFSFVPGQTRYGIQGTAQASESTLVRFDVEQENNFGNTVILRPRFFDLFDPNPTVASGASVDNNLFTAKVGIAQEIGSADVGVDFVHRNRDDGKDTSLSSSSNQLVSRLRVPLGEKFAFRAQNELNITEDGDELYPNRTTLGVEWDTFPGVKLRLAHQFFGGGIIDNSAITSLDTIVERALSDDTTLTSRYSVAGTQGGFNNYGSIGLNHRWVVSPGLKVNLGYERIFDNLFDRTGAGSRQESAYTQGQTAAVLGLSEGSSYSIGADYTGSDRFKANGRLEYRDTEDGDLFLASAAGVGKINDRLSILGRIESAGASNQTFIDRLSDTLDLDLGLAYRDPLNDRFNGLLRVEHRVNGDITPDSIGTGAESRATLVSAEGIYAPNWRWEFYGKYAMRWTETSLNGGFSNDSRVSLAQARALYRFDYRWDVAGEARWLNQPTADFSEWGWAGELGYYLNPDLRAYLGYSFGSADDRDFGGYRSDGGLYGGVNFKVNRLFNDFGVQMPVAKPDNDEVQALDASASQDPLFDSVDSDPFAEDIAPAAESVAPEFQEALPAEDSAQEIPRALF